MVPHEPNEQERQAENIRPKLPWRKPQVTHISITSTASGEPYIIEIDTFAGVAS